MDSNPWAPFSPEAVEVVAGEDEEPLFPPVAKNVNWGKLKNQKFKLLHTSPTDCFHGMPSSLDILSRYMIYCHYINKDSQYLIYCQDICNNNTLPGKEPVPLLPEKTFLHSTASTFLHKKLMLTPEFWLSQLFWKRNMSKTLPSSGAASSSTASTRFRITTFTCVTLQQQQSQNKLRC